MTQFYHRIAAPDGVSCRIYPTRKEAVAAVEAFLGHPLAQAERSLSEMAAPYDTQKLAPAGLQPDPKAYVA